MQMYSNLKYGGLKAQIEDSLPCNTSSTNGGVCEQHIRYFRILPILNSSDIDVIACMIDVFVNVKSCDAKWTNSTCLWISGIDGRDAPAGNITCMKRFLAIWHILTLDCEVYQIYHILFWKSILHQNCYLYVMHQFFNQRLHSNKKCDSLCWIKKSALFRFNVKVTETLRILVRNYTKMFFWSLSLLW